MDEFKNITRNDIEEKLTGEHLRINRIISLALCAGPLFFLLVIVFLYQKNLSSNVEISQDNIVEEMIIVLSVLAVGVYSFYFIFPNIFLKKANLVKQLSMPQMDKNNRLITDPVLKIIALDRTLMIIRLALLEGIALFSLVVLIQSLFIGVIYYNSNYWLLSIPVFIVIAVVFTNYFSKEKTVSRIESGILYKLQD